MCVYLHYRGVRGQERALAALKLELVCCRVSAVNGPRASTPSLRSSPLAAAPSTVSEFVHVLVFEPGGPLQHPPAALIIEEAGRGRSLKR